MKLLADEYSVINTIISRTKMDCWCSLCTDKKGNDYIFDLEENEGMSMERGIAIIADGIFDNATYQLVNLTPREDLIWRMLCKKCGIGFYARVKNSIDIGDTRDDIARKLNYFVDTEDGILLTNARIYFDLLGKASMIVPA